jgi:hypothetical protein
MLTRALQRNAEHEARLSNISSHSAEIRSFASLRMTVARRILDLRIEVQKWIYPSNNFPR